MCMNYVNLFILLQFCASVSATVAKFTENMEGRLAHSWWPRNDMYTLIDFRKAVRT